MSKLAKTCAIKPVAIAWNAETARRHLIARIIITLLLSSMLVVACGPTTPSNSSSSSDTNVPLVTGTDTPTATPKTTKGSTQSASSTTPSAKPTTAGNTQPGSNPEPPTATASKPGVSSTTPPAPPSGGQQPPAGPDKSNSPTGPTTVVEADPSSFTVTIHGFDPTVTAGQKSDLPSEVVELDNADQTGIINWSVLIEMFDGKGYHWLSVSPSGGTVPPGKQGQSGISTATIEVSVPLTMPPGDYKGCVEFRPPAPQDHCNNADNEANKEVAVDLTVVAAASTSTSPPAAQPTPPSQQPVVSPTPTSQQVAPPTPTSQEPVAPPTPTTPPVAPPTPTPQQPVAPPTPTST